MKTVFGLIVCLMAALAMEAQDSAAIYYILGQQQKEAEEYEKALNSFTKSIAISPSDSAYMARAMSWRDARKSILDYDTALQLNPNNWYAYLSRAGQYSYLKNYKKAINDYKIASTMQPDSSQGYYGMGMTLLMQNKYEQAVKQYSKAIEKRSNSSDLYFWRASAYYGLQNYGAALVDLNKAEELNPLKVNLQGIYVKRSFCKGFLGDTKGECEDLYKAANAGNDGAKRKYLEKCKQ